MLPEYATKTIPSLVRAGFHDRARIIEIVCEELFSPGEVDEVEVASAVDVEFGKVRAEQQLWPTTTDCDRLDQAFVALRHQGVIALHNAGYTQSDGYEDSIAAFEEAADKDRIEGYCFYHGQDVERAVGGGGLNLAFGPIDPSKETSRGPEIGKIICQALEHFDLVTEWKGTFNSRILIPRFKWQKRTT